MITVPAVYAIIDDNDLMSMFNQCIKSKIVVTNPAYSKVAANTRFVPCIESNTINASAACPDIDRMKFEIDIYGGLVNLVGQFAFIKTLHDVGMPTGKVLKLISWTRMRFLQNPKTFEQSVSQLTINMVNSVKMDFAKYILNSMFNELWRSNILSCMLFCIAHELGHACLGHCLDGGYSGNVNSSNRNIERAADLFACSVLQSGHNVSSSGICAMWSMMSLYCIGMDMDNVSDKTHPASLERINNIRTSFNGIVNKRDVDLVMQVVSTIRNTKTPKLKSNKKGK